MTNLSQKKCIPCQGGTPPLTSEEITPLLDQLQNWALVNTHHIKKEWTFPNFKEALNFTNQVGDIAEEEGHHPDIYLAWGKVVLTVWTHKIDGLTESDFIFAAKTDRAFGSPS